MKVPDQLDMQLDTPNLDNIPLDELIAWQEVFALLADLERQECGSRRERTLAEQSALGMVLAVVNSPAVSATPTRRPR